MQRHHDLRSVEPLLDGRPCARNVLGQRRGLQHAVFFRERHHAANLVLQLPHVAGPPVEEQMFHRLFGEADLAFVELGGGASEEVVDEAGNLVASLAERWNAKTDDVEPVEEILAKAVVAHEQLEIGVGGCDDADVHRERRFAERRDLARFEEPQELGLEVEAELADFVEEERPVSGAPDQAGVVAVGARERTAAMAEQLAFEHFARHRGAVEGDERLLRAGRKAMDGACKDFLTGAALAGEKYAHVGRRDAASERHELAHLAADDGLAVFDGDVFDGPEREALFALGAGALEVMDGGEQEHDRVERGHRFDVALGVDEELDVAIARDANRNAAGGVGRWFGRQRVAACREQLRVIVLAAGDGGGACDALRFGQQVDELASEELRSSRV